MGATLELEVPIDQLGEEDVAMATMGIAYEGDDLVGTAAFESVSVEPETDDVFRISVAERAQVTVAAIAEAYDSTRNTIGEVDWRVAALAPVVVLGSVSLDSSRAEASSVLARGPETPEEVEACLEEMELGDRCVIEDDGEIRTPRQNNPLGRLLPEWDLRRPDCERDGGVLSAIECGVSLGAAGGWIVGRSLQESARVFDEAANAIVREIVNATADTVADEVGSLSEQFPVPGLGGTGPESGDDDIREVPADEPREVDPPVIQAPEATTPTTVPQASDVPAPQAPPETIAPEPARPDDNSGNEGQVSDPREVRKTDDCTIEWTLNGVTERRELRNVPGCPSD